MSKITPFLMFEGAAEAAMDFYVSLFPGGRIEDITRYGPEGPGKEGSVVRATFVLEDQRVMCIDSPAQHGFTFTPSFSFFVDCETDGDLQRLIDALSQGGAFLMPPDNYGFSRRFAWLNDRFGVSWQLNLP